MPPQQRLRDRAGRVWPKYRYMAWAAVGLKGFGRRQVAFVGPPEAMSFCELPSLFFLHFPSHRPQSSSASRFKFVRFLGGAAATCGRAVSDLRPRQVSDRFPLSWRGTSKAPGTVFLLVLSPACVPTGLIW